MIMKQLTTVKPGFNEIANIIICNDKTALTLVFIVSI